MSIQNKPIQSQNNVSQIIYLLYFLRYLRLFIFAKTEYIKTHVLCLFYSLLSIILKFH